MISGQILLALAALALFAASFTGSRAVPQEDELFPCDPAPPQVRICELRGGTFDYVTCSCVFP